MRFLPFAKRNMKEILRDPLSLIFGIGFPVVLMLIMTSLQKNMTGMPVEVFGIQAFAPGMILFGFGFLSMFLGLLMASDKENLFLERLFSSPLKHKDYLLGYGLPVLPIAYVQCGVGFVVAILLGLEVSWHLAMVFILILPIGILFISIGLLFGTLFTNKQVSGVGTILINGVAWFSGAWFSLDMVEGVFKRIADILPFSYALHGIKGVLNGDFTLVGRDLLVIMTYTVIILITSTYCFKRKMQQ